MMIWVTLILIACIACVLVLYGALAVFSDIDDFEEEQWNRKGGYGKAEDREDD